MGGEDDIAESIKIILRFIAETKKTIDETKKAVMDPFLKEVSRSIVETDFEEYVKKKTKGDKDLKTILELKKLAEKLLRGES